MQRDSEDLFVKSHVARDLLQTAALFKNERVAVWEYVANGLQYSEDGRSPVVRVKLESRVRKITISDNGRGMDWSDLRNFFIMHGENQDRRQGRPGRGRFGTGKSAAFGIANTLRITSVHDGRRSRVELCRSEIQAVSSGDEIPVRVLEREARTDEPSGTVVEIEEVQLRSLDQAGLIRYIERHLSRWPRDSVVVVNNHVCEVVEPPVASEKKFRPEGSLRDILGEVELTVKVSRVPLEEDLRGVAIYSKGVWHETTLAGSEGREMCQYLFGELDVPGLEDDQSPISPFDVSRSMQLNPLNEVVQAAYAFIGQSVEAVRRELADAERRRKATEDAKKLAAQAEEIARVINDDFDEFRNRVMRVRAKAGHGPDLRQTDSGNGSDSAALLPGTTVPAKEGSPTGNPGATGGSGRGGSEPRTLFPILEPEPSSEKVGRQAGTNYGGKKSSGGFRVKFENMGVESNRAKYVPDERTIYVNLDHPQLAAAKGENPVDDPLFRKLTYEITFSEYAIALATELAQVDGNYMEFTDPIVEIRETVNRLTRKGAYLFSDHR